MDLTFSEQDEAFRKEARQWLADHLRGEFEVVKGRGGPGDEEALFDERLAWERLMGEHGWTCVGWPKEAGGRGATILQQVIWNEEYARAKGPGRLNHIGETLTGPTIIAFGTDDQKERFLPKIRLVQELWCQGYSEPNAGSDLANVQTRAELDGDEWVIHGQKTWTSGAHWSDWCFVLCRTSQEDRKHRGLSYLLVPMAQEGVAVQPIVQMTKECEFNEVFFDGARAAKDDVVGGVGNGWRVAMGTLAFERGVSTIGQQLSFVNEFDHILKAARDNGSVDDPLIRDRLADVYTRLRIMRLHALRTLPDDTSAALESPALVNKLFWATLHRDMGELAMDILGHEGDLIAEWGYELKMLQQLFLFSRSDTIYAGTNQIQRNIIAQRGLGLPRHRG